MPAEKTGRRPETNVSKASGKNVPSAAGRKEKHRGRKHAPFVGILVPDLLHESCMRLIRSVQAKLSAQGILSILLTTEDDPDAAASCLRFLIDRHADGIICVPGRTPLPDIKTDIPFLFLNSEPLKDPFRNSMLIEADSLEIGRTAAEFLLMKGCMTFGVLMDDAKLPSHAMRFEGFRAVLASGGVSPDAVVLFRANSRKTDSALSVLAPFAESGMLPHGIFAMEPAMTLAAKKAMQEFSVSFHLIGFGDLPLHDLGLIHADILVPPLEEMAAKAVDALRMLMAGQAERSVYRFPVTLK